MPGRSPFVLLDDARAEGAADALLFEAPRQVFVARRPGEVAGALAAAGVATSPEVGRQVIREQLAAGGTALPWGDEIAFAEAMWPREVAAHELRPPARGRRQVVHCPVPHEQAQRNVRRVLRQRAHEVAAEEAGAARDEDAPAAARGRGHGG